MRVRQKLLAASVAVLGGFATVTMPVGGADAAPVVPSAAAAPAAPSWQVPVAQVGAFGKVPVGDVPCCGRLYARPGSGLDGYIYSGGLPQDGVVATYDNFALGGQFEQQLSWPDAPATNGRYGYAFIYPYNGPGTTVVFQSDGNLVTYDRDGTPLWASNTAGRTDTYFGPYGNGDAVIQDANGQVLALVGASRQPLTVFPGVVIGYAASPAAIKKTPSVTTSKLVVQDDGNLVLYRTDGTTGATRAVWASNTAGQGPVHLMAQADGNLVLYKYGDAEDLSGPPVWASNTQGPTGYYQLDAQDDGNLVLYRTDNRQRLNPVWATGTVN